MNFINKHSEKLLIGTVLIACIAGYLIGGPKPEPVVRTYYFATDRPGILTMVGTSDPCYIKRLDGFAKDEKLSQKIDAKGRTVVTLKKTLSNLNEVADKAIEEAKELGVKNEY